MALYLGTQLVAGGGSAADISVGQVLKSGEHIATISAGATATALYAPNDFARPGHKHDYSDISSGTPDGRITSLETSVSKLHEILSVSVVPPASDSELAPQMVVALSTSASGKYERCRFYVPVDGWVAVETSCASTAYSTQCDTRAYLLDGQGSELKSPIFENVSNRTRQTFRAKGKQTVVVDAFTSPTTDAQAFRGIYYAPDYVPDNALSLVTRSSPAPDAELVNNIFLDSDPAINGNLKYVDST